MGCKNNVWTFPAYAEVANFIMPNTLPVLFFFPLTVAGKNLLGAVGMGKISVCVQEE